MLPDTIKPGDNHDVAGSDESLDNESGESQLMTIREFAEFKSNI